MSNTLFENAQHNAFMFFVNMNLNNTIHELVTRLKECESIKITQRTGAFRPAVWDDRPDWETADIIAQAVKEEKEIMQALIVTANIMEAEHGISA